MDAWIMRKKRDIISIFKEEEKDDEEKIFLQFVKMLFAVNHD